MPGLNGRQNKVTCGFCRGSGKCRNCAGEGRTAQKCVTCQGEGRVQSRALVESVYLRLLGEMSGPPADAPNPRAPAANAAEGPYAAGGEPAQSWESMGAFVDAVRELRRQFAAATVADAELADVIHSRGAYSGRVVRATAYLVGGHPRAVPVVSTPAGGPGPELVLTPDSYAVGARAAKVFKNGGEGVGAVVTFGVLNAAQTVLFEIEPLSR